MSPTAKTAIKVLVSYLVLAGFIALWVSIGWRLWHYMPTTDKPKFDLDADTAALAVLLSATVGASAAAALGFELGEFRRNQMAVGVTPSWFDLVIRFFKIMFSKSVLMVVACVSYIAVGAFIVVVYRSNRGEAPDSIAAFYLSVVGWFLGAFASTFKD